MIDLHALTLRLAVRDAEERLRRAHADRIESLKMKSRYLLDITWNRAVERCISELRTRWISGSLRASATEIADTSTALRRLKRPVRRAA